MVLQGEAKASFACEDAIYVPHCTHLTPLNGKKKCLLGLRRHFFVSGGGGSRTRVRIQIPPKLYVRIPLFFSPRPFVGQQKASHEPAT